MNIIKALFTSNFWMSGLAIARYIPRSFRVQQVDGSLFYSEEKRQEFRRRVERDGIEVICLEAQSPQLHMLDVGFHLNSHGLSDKCPRDQLLSKHF